MQPAYDNPGQAPDLVLILPTEVLIKLYGDDRRVEINGKELRPDRSQRIINHSPDGFNWGYAGSGPAQLALAILLEFMPEGYALGLYQRFKQDVVARWERKLRPGFNPGQTLYHGINLNLQEEIDKIISSQ